MLYFASVVSICDDTTSYRINTYQDCATNLAEEYQDEDSLFYWELPSWTGLIAGGNFQHRPAFGILRAKDQQSLSLKVRFPPAIISHAKSREDREVPWDYRWHNNLTGYNPDRVGHKIKRNSLRRHGVKLISWKKYFSKEKADIKFRKEVHKNSEKNARDEALKLEKLVNPRRTKSPSPPSGSQGQKPKTSEGKRSTSTPSAGGNPNAKRKSEQDKGAGKAKEKVTQAISSRSLREYLVDSGAALHIISKHALTKEELRTVRKLREQVMLQTANGMIIASHEAKVHVVELDLSLWAIILKDSPCLISMGKLCREHGFTFMQVGANPPFLQKGRLKVECQTHFDVPLINPSRRSLSEMREALESRGEPEDLFDECFQEEELVPTSQGPEPELGETFEPEGPPELEDSTEDETPRVKSERC